MGGRHLNSPCADLIKNRVNNTLYYIAISPGIAAFSCIPHAPGLIVEEDI